MKKCQQCGHPWKERRTPGFHEVCEGCDDSLHSCLNCRFYLAGANQWCHEPMAREERPRDPQAANTCSYYLLSEENGRGGRETGPSAARRELEALFGAVPPKGEKTPPWTRGEEESAEDIEDLFKSNDSSA